MMTLLPLPRAILSNEAKRKTELSGFTLAELLIALGILGVIAAFTIPKILTSQQTGQNIAKTKEAISMVSAAYQKMQADGVVTTATVPSDFIPYLNYVKLDTSGTVIDSIRGEPSRACDSYYKCVVLHNGGVLWFHTPSFGGTTSLNVIEFIFDPDPVNNTTATADGPLKAVQFGLYYNGQAVTRGAFKSGSLNNVTTVPLNNAYDPAWFSW